MKKLLFGIVMLQLLLLVGEMWRYESMMRSRRVVRLRVVSRDRRSLYYGQFMDLAFDVSTFDVSSLRSCTEVDWMSEEHCQRVYVAPNASEEGAKSVDVTRELPEHPDSLLVYVAARGLHET